MDAFYASVDQRDNPDLRGKPVAVGGSRERGVVAAASYEARAFRVHSAMPSITAKRKCPDLIFVRPRFDAYKAISLQIREIFAEYTPIIEPLSLDEAYLDVTENLKGISLATQIAEEIRARVRAETVLTAAAGVSQLMAPRFGNRAIAPAHPIERGSLSLGAVGSYRVGPRRCQTISRAKME
jgi:DNA polymerase-4